MGLMNIDWAWFHRHVKEIVIALLGILLVVIIEHWAIGTNNFLRIITLFLNHVIESLLIILIILLIVVYWHSERTNE